MTMSGAKSNTWGSSTSRRRLVTLSMPLLVSTWLKA
jgi:hypothetical protein